MIKTDSDEEIYFTWYLEELKEKDIILSYDRADSILLSEGGEMGLKEHVYTPDFKVIWNPDKYEYWDLFKIKYFYDEVDHYSIIEVKPAHDFKNMTRIFSINQKWTWDKHGIFVQKIVPEKHFKKTFTPNRFLKTTITGKPRKINYTPILSYTELCQKLKKPLK